MISGAKGALPSDATDFTALFVLSKILKTFEICPDRAEEKNRTE